MTGLIKAESEPVIKDLAVASDIDPNGNRDTGNDTVDKNDINASETTESEFAHDAAVNDTKVSEEDNAESKN